MQEFTDDLHELVLRNKEITRQVLDAMPGITPCAEAQVLALITAATCLIEKSVGPMRADPVLIGFLQPTIAEWELAARQTVQ